MRKNFLPFVAAVLVLSLQPGLALAYIGPGVGAGAIGAVLGVIGSIFLAIFAVVWYPVSYTHLDVYKRQPQNSTRC